MLNEEQCSVITRALLDTYAEWRGDKPIAMVAYCNKAFLVRDEQVGFGAHLSRLENGEAYEAGFYYIITIPDFGHPGFCKIEEFFFWHELAELKLYETGIFSEANTAEEEVRLRSSKKWHEKEWFCNRFAELMVLDSCGVELIGPANIELFFRLDSSMVSKTLAKNCTEPWMIQFGKTILKVYSKNKDVRHKKELRELGKIMLGPSEKT